MSNNQKKTIKEILLLKRAEMIGEQLLPYVQENDSILDFGCSYMTISKYMQSQKKISITGIDISDYKVEDANFVKYKGGKLPFDDNQFDVVFSIFVLHHTDNPDFYLKELIRVSKRTIIICEDSFTNIIGKMLTILVDLILNFPFYGTKFKSLNEWKELFKNNSVKLIEYKRIYIVLFPSFIRLNVLMELKK